MSLQGVCTSWFCGFSLVLVLVAFLMGVLVWFLLLLFFCWLVGWLSTTSLALPFVNMGACISICKIRYLPS